MASSKNEERKAVLIAMRKFKHGITSDVSCAFIARVVSYDRKKHLADLQPLANSSAGEESAQYLDIPVAENCYILDEMIDALKSEFAKADVDHALPAHAGVPAHSHTQFVSKLPKKRLIRPGVPVVCVILDRDNDNWEGGNAANTYTPNSSRMHDANDAIVVGVLGGTWLNG